MISNDPRSYAITKESNDLCVQSHTHIINTTEDVDFKLSLLKYLSNIYISNWAVIHYDILSV